MRLSTKGGVLAGFGGKVSLAIASLCLAATALAAGTGNDAVGGNKVTGGPRPSLSTISPNNSTVGSARMLVPDGSSVYANFGTDAQQWYMFQAEPGKTYVIDLFDPYGNNGSGPDGLALFDSDGVSAPPEANSNCSAAGLAPGVSPNFGYRCVLRMFAPASTTLQNRRVYIEAFPFFSNTSYQIRVSEATIYGRWTTNGYDMHIELQNTTGQALCAQIYLYGNSGLTYSAGSWSGPIEYLGDFTVPAYGAVKTVVPAFHLVGSDNKGTWRVHACNFASANLTPGALNVSAYAYSTIAKQYLIFPASGPNGSYNGTSGSY